MGTGNESVGIPGAGQTAFPYFSTKNILVIKKTRHNRLQEASSELSSVIDSFTVFFFLLSLVKSNCRKSVEATENNALKSVRLPILRVIC